MIDARSQAVQLRQPDAGAAPPEDRRQHRPRRGAHERQGDRRGGGRPRSRSPARSRSSRARKQVDRPVPRSGPATPSAPRSRCAASACGTSSSASPRSRCPASATSAACPSKSFDGRGNYSLGLREQLAFPEIDYDKVDRLRGLEISIVTTAKTDEESKRLLELLGMPFAVVARGRETTWPRSHSSPRRSERRSSRSAAINRCSVCGRPRGYIRRFALCRICFRERALARRDAGRDQVELVGRPMNVSDPIADMLTRIRNASRARHRRSWCRPRAPSARSPASSRDEGFIADVARISDGAAPDPPLTLKYVDGKAPVVSGLKRISKPGLRVYAARPTSRACSAGSASSSSVPARGS